MRSATIVGIWILIAAFTAAAADIGLTVLDAHGKPRDMETMIAHISETRAVFIGESHDRYDQHLSELEIIRRLVERDPKRWAIGVEFIQRPFQRYLDDYISGAISEREFLKKSEYFDRWGFDFRLYRPIFQFAKEHGIPMVALNAEEELSKQVAKVGVEGLSSPDRERLPSQIDKSDRKYRKSLEEIFNQHPEAAGGNFEHFWEAQLLWDETMAERAAGYLSLHADKSIIVLAGAGHIEFGHGIPDRVRRRLPFIKTAMLITADKPESESHQADYFLVSKEQELSPAPKVGIVMEVRDGLRVKDVTANGPAAEVGIMSRDRILALDGQDVTSPADIRLALLDKNIGDHVVLLIQRAGSRDLTFQLTLR